MVNELTCPNCSTMMRANQRYGVDIDFCPSCKGIWLDRGEIEKIANASKKYDETLHIQMNVLHIQINVLEIMTIIQGK